MPRGRKPGSKGKNNDLKDELRKFLRKKVAKEFGPMIDAQIAQAKGISYLVVREKLTGKFVRVAETRAKLTNPAEEIVEVWEKDPSTQAFDSLANRTIDKPAETLEGSLGLTGALTIKWEGE
jgi:hypothetical protein